MKQLFVTPEIAIALKEKGFNEPCLGHYNSNNEFMFFADVRNCNTNSEFGFYPTVPTYQQAVDWFREKHSILIAVDNDGKEFFYVFTFLKDNDRHILEGFNSYYEAFEKAIKESLKLI